MPRTKLGPYEVEYLQVLDEAGKLDKDLEPKLSKTDLLKLYRYMKLSRRADERMLKLQRQGRLGTLPVCVGQEASFCGSVLAIRDTDWFVGAYRELGGRLMRGEPIVNTLLYYNGYEEGSYNPNNDRTLPIQVVLGSQTLHAVGLAYASRLRGEKDTVALTILGDGASSEGDFHEAMNFAAVWNTPTVFLVQNNHWAISTPRDIQTKSETFAQKAIAYGVPGIQVDGNDALAVYAATAEAVERARKGGGPTLVEAVTYRMLMHTTADDPSKYRSKEAVEEWQVRDPLARMFNYLKKKKLWTDKQEDQLEAEIKAEIDEAVKAYENFTEGKPDAPFDYVYGEPHYYLEEQREELLEKIRKDAEDA
ncbi:pyruvate dehydrogenase (acetyl-transferring) E1 component subunit alpha [bacterium]|nr:pyruvate dehydrogenase (acetyl-transferring) E1 component subunit alpha [bacterium]